MSDTAEWIDGLKTTSREMYDLADEMLRKANAVSQYVTLIENELKPPEERKQVTNRKRGGK